MRLPHVENMEYKPDANPEFIMYIHNKFDIWRIIKPHVESILDNVSDLHVFNLA